MEDPVAERRVRTILDAVRREGDRAVIRYTHRFDGLSLAPAGMRLSKDRIRKAYTEVPPTVVDHLKQAATRIFRFHERQKTATWTYQDNGATLGMRVRALDCAGLYVPGGQASYPSSVLMNAIPAKVAGCPRVVICSPTPHGRINPAVLVAADLVGVDEIYTIGGPQAVGAMAYGTSAVPKVDKIVGPGNLYVALAKRMVFGEVDIDMIAGPSEIVVIADDTARPDFVAADLLSQAEHDERAVSILITPSRSLVKKTLAALSRQLKTQPRRRIIAAALKRFGLAVVARDLEEATAVANAIAPEHLQLAVAEPAGWLDRIRNTGAIFAGHYTTEALGDYLAGPNHVLPTGGTARFGSPLSVEDFVKRTSLLSFTPESLKPLVEPAAGIARLEGLEAHARAIEIRMKERS
jgi:histidinol dehydrogenase